MHVWIYMLHEKWWDKCYQNGRFQWNRYRYCKHKEILYVCLLLSVLQPIAFQYDVLQHSIGTRNAVALMSSSNYIYDESIMFVSSAIDDHLRLLLPTKETKTPKYGTAPWIHQNPYSVSYTFNQISSSQKSSYGRSERYGNRCSNGKQGFIAHKCQCQCRAAPWQNTIPPTTIFFFCRWWCFIIIICP